MSFSLLKSITVFVLLILLSFPDIAQAVDGSYLSCRSALRQSNCDLISNTAVNAQEIYLTVSCNLCTVTGWEVRCPTTEMVNGQNLTLENASGNLMSGTFSASGACEGIPLYHFAGALSSGTYRVMATAGGLSKTLVLTFNVAGSTGGSGSSVGTSVGTSVGSSVGSSSVGTSVGSGSVGGGSSVGNGSVGSVGTESSGDTSSAGSGFNSNPHWDEKYGAADDDAGSCAVASTQASPIWYLIFLLIIFWRRSLKK